MDGAMTLDMLPPGQAGRVAALTARGHMRRRLMDLGFTPGAPVEKLFTAAAGDPSAYWIRDTVIALRSRDAGTILAEPAAPGGTACI